MFTGIYYDGRSSKGHSAHIEFYADGVHISYSDGSPRRVTVVWDVANIHRGNFAHSASIQLRYGASPIQYLEVSDPDFLDSLTRNYPEKKFNAADLEFLRRAGPWRIAAVSIGFVLLVLVSYVFILPPFAEFWAARISLQTEESLGNKMYENVMQSYKVDQRLTKQANGYWRAMHISSPYTVNITIVDEPQANAFALPGGQIIIFNGIIREMKDYNELAGLLAHEYSHIKLRHSLRMLSRNLAGYVFISILLNDASGSIAILATNANALKELGFSREMEHQADQGGYDLLRSAHIDPGGMMALFKTLKSVHGESISMTEFISTHPLTDSRIAYIKSRLEKDSAATSYERKDLEEIWKEMTAEE